MENGSREILLRSPNMKCHLKNQAYFGAIVGRFANRIYQGSFSIGDDDYQVTVNNGKNSLHGGESGFDKRRWSVKSQSANRIVFSLFSIDGDQGYPGNMYTRYHSRCKVQQVMR